MKHLLSILIVFTLSLPILAGGEPVSYEKVMSMSKADVEQHWKKNSLPKFLVRISNGVDIYELEYMSSLPNGTPIKASGLVFVPRGFERKDKTTMMVYHHGTDMLRERKVNLKGEQTISLVFAADGYLVLMPDYFGLGKSTGLHPYQHAETEAQSSIDMIRAVRKSQEKFDFDCEEKIFITGYSQGGHAAMSTHKFITERHSDEFKVWASSPMSGAYDMTGAQGSVMFNPYTNPGYLPYILFGYNQIYNFFESPSEVLKAPYDSILPTFFDGNYSMSQVNKVMPEIPKDVFKEEAVKAFQEDPGFPFRKALEENNVYDWKANEPVMLCYCEADEQVFYQNSIVAHEAMTKKGSKSVMLRPTGKDFDHTQCAVYATIYTKYWFDSFRKGSKNGRKGDAFKLFLLEIGRKKLTRNR